jgi:hypothetical protein
MGESSKNPHRRFAAFRVICKLYSGDSFAL